MNGVIKAKYFKIEWLMLLSGNIHILYIVQQQWLVMLPIFAIYMLCFAFVLGKRLRYFTQYEKYNNNTISFLLNMDGCVAFSLSLCFE